MTEQSTSEESPFFQLVTRRTSCRKYKTDPVPEEHIDLMIEAARLSPSACNKQPWRFAVVTTEEVRHRLIRETLLPGINMKWGYDAPIIVALGMERSFVTHKVATKVSGVDYPLIDVGIAGEHLVLQATELGLGTCWIGWIRPKLVRDIVGWPTTIEPVSLITVGLPAEEGKPRPRLGTDEMSIRL